MKYLLKVMTFIVVFCFFLSSCTSSTEHKETSVENTSTTTFSAHDDTSKQIFNSMENAGLKLTETQEEKINSLVHTIDFTQNEEAIKASMKDLRKQVYGLLSPDQLNTFQEFEQKRNAKQGN